MIDPVSIGMLLGSFALSQVANKQAANRQKAAAQQAQARQLQAQNRATDAAMKRVQDFDPGTRKQRQDEIQGEMTGQLEQVVAQPQITAQGIQVGSTIPDAEGGSDYLKAKAREQVKSTESLRALAALMGRTGSASELRRGEAVGMGDTAGEIGRIQSGANNIAGIDQIGIQAAGQPSVGLGLASAALGAYGTSRMAGAGLGGAPRTNDMGLGAKLTGANPTGWWLRNGVGAD